MKAIISLVSKNNNNNYFNKLFNNKFKFVLNINQLIDFLNNGTKKSSINTKTNDRFLSNSTKLATNHLFLILILLLISFIPVINCELNSSQSRENAIKSKDSLNYVDNKSSQEVSRVSHQLSAFFNVFSIY
jgi:hypothetical protein